MNNTKKPDAKRGEAAFIFAIVLGLLLGIAIKRIRIGIMIGLVLGLLIVFTGLLRSSRKKNMQDNDKIPFFKTWNQWYVFVIVFLIALIFLFSLFTRYFN